MKLYRLRTMSVVLFLLSAVVPLRGATNYVDWQAAGTNGGTSWQDAYTNLPFALGRAVAGDQIWVAYGTYLPSNGTDRSASIALQGNVSVYGGFTNGMTALSQRNWTNYPTILSGDIGAAGVNTDNSYNVVLSANNALLDGVTVADGYADTVGSSHERGAGLLIAGGGSMTVDHCVFTRNEAKYYGGAVNVGGSATIRNTTFVSNRVNVAATTGGGAIFLSGTSILLESCTFRGNYSQQYGGAFFSWANSPITVKDCLFAGNVANSDGGAYCAFGPGSPLFTNCTFIGNSSSGYGGALNLGSSTVEGCVFVGNRAQTAGGAAYAYGSATFRNCVLSDNRRETGSSGKGGGFFLDGAVLVERCLIAGSEAYIGGGIFVNNSSPTIRNCVIAGNAIPYYGAGIAIMYGGSPRIVNCTVAENAATNSGGWGGGLFNQSAQPTLTNCIFWGNWAKSNGNEFYNRIAGATTTVSYCDINGGWNGSNVYNDGGIMVNGGGNTATNPLFARGDTGIWETVSAYDPDTGQMTLTDTDATWTAGALVKCTVNPATNQWRQFIIVTNSATTVTIWGDATAFATNGAAYRIFNPRLQSATGRWTPLGWVHDSAYSPCIDAGIGDYSLEPSPNGRRVNIGFDGNTPTASKSYPPGTIIKVY